MRERKFRAWNGTRFLNPSDFCIFGDGSLYLLDDKTDLGCGRTHINNLSAEIIQFTGLLDKNGVEIYDGDILRSRTGRIAQVFIKKGNCSFDCIVMAGKGSCDDFYIPRWGKIEVIGNIYENPELLS